MTTDLSRRTDAEIYRPLWEDGDLEFLLDEEQRWVWWAFWYLPPDVFRIVLHWTRRGGKTFSVIVCFMALMIRFPGKSCFYLHQTQKTGKRLVIAAFQKIIDTCPEDLQPEQLLTDGTIRWPQHGGQILVGGLNTENDLNAVMGHAQLAIAVDEAGLIRGKILPKALKALVPMLMGQPGPHRFFMLSNKALGVSHPFFKELDRAKLKGAGSELNIYQIGRYSAEEIEWFKEDAGGELSPAWQEEYMLSRFSEDESKIVPEFAPRAFRSWVAQVVKAKRSIDDVEPRDMVVVRPPRENEYALPPIVRVLEPPEFYDRYVCIDLGYIDFAVALFGFYHFTERVLVITHEKAFRLATLDVIAPELDTMEKALWPGEAPYSQLCDGDPMDINTLGSLGWWGSPVKRRDPRAQVNELRVGMAGCRVAIHPRCTTLIEQLTVGEWGPGDKFSRDFPEHGHFDAVASLVYMYNNVDWDRNPWPAIHPSLFTGKHTISPKLLRQPENGLEALAEDMSNGV